MSITQTPPDRNRPLTGDARRWAAARDEYLAGSPAEAVCRRHDLRLATFRRRALREGWRRMDQPPPAPAPAPPSQDDPLVIPAAPEALSGTPLTAGQMVDKAWSHVQAAVAAGRLIEARGWLRLYKELKPFVRYEEIAAREARMEREATERRAAEAAAEAPADEESVAPPLHCFSASESHAPPRAGAEPTRGPAVEDVSKAVPAKERARVIAEPRAVTTRAGEALNDGTVRLSLHCFSRPESHHPGQGP